MIKTVADMLGQFLEVERAKLDAVKVRHATTIGGMYEHLSRDALCRVIPCEGLWVASGFIEDSAGVSSDEPRRSSYDLGRPTASRVRPAVGR